MSSTTTEVTTTMTDYISVTTINNLPDELLRIISVSAGPTEYCNFRRAMKRVWLTTTGREDHCIKHFLVTEVDEYGTIRTTLCGKYHSTFGKPAIIWADGVKDWYQHGKLHRDNDQPATICSDGTQMWFQRGKRHRDDDLPAYIDLWGAKEWYQYGERHRDNDLPAITHPDGTKYWYQYGERHRDNDLPAIIYPDGTQRWYQHWIEYTP